MPKVNTLSQFSHRRSNRRSRHRSQKTPSTASKKKFDRKKVAALPDSTSWLPSCGELYAGAKNGVSRAIAIAQSSTSAAARMALNKMSQMSYVEMLQFMSKFVIAVPAWAYDMQACAVIDDCLAQNSTTPLTSFGEGYIWRNGPGQLTYQLATNAYGTLLNG